MAIALERLLPDEHKEQADHTARMPLFWYEFVLATEVLQRCELT